MLHSKRQNYPWCLGRSEAALGWVLQPCQELGDDGSGVFGGWGYLPEAGTEWATGQCSENLVSRLVTDPAVGRGDSEPAGVSLSLAGAAMGSASTGTDCFGA